MTTFVLLLFLAGLQAQPCVASPSAPALDHAIIVVRDLAAAAASFEQHGFRIKPGRLHPNGLLNRHVKFRDGTEIELMTIQGKPGDAMARGYAEMLAAGEGGVYLALEAADVAVVRSAASHVRVRLRERKYGPWTFLSFPGSRDTAAIFLTAGDAPVSDPESLFSHRPDVTGLAEVWVEGGPALGEMLQAMGARSCGDAPRSDGPPGRRWSIRGGSIVIVPAPASSRPRLLGAVLALRSGGAPPAKIYPHPKFWIRYQ